MSLATIFFEGTKIEANGEQVQFCVEEKRRKIAEKAEENV
jgi:hypothetical protein